MCKGYKCVCYRKENNSEKSISFSFEVYRRFKNYRDCYYDASTIILDGLTNAPSGSCGWTTECGVMIADYAQLTANCRKDKEFRHQSEKYTYVVKVFCITWG